MLAEGSLWLLPRYNHLSRAHVSERGDPVKYNTGFVEIRSPFFFVVILKIVILKGRNIFGGMVHKAINALSVILNDILLVSENRKAIQTGRPLIK